MFGIDTISVLVIFPVDTPMTAAKTLSSKISPTIWWPKCCPFHKIWIWEDWEIDYKPEVFERENHFYKNQYTFKMKLKLDLKNHE